MTRELLTYVVVACVILGSGCGGNGAGAPETTKPNLNGNADQALVERASAYAKLMQSTSLDTDPEAFRRDFEDFLKPDARGDRAANIAYSQWTGSGLPIQSCRLAEIVPDDSDPNKSRVYLEATYGSSEPSDAARLGSTWHKIDEQWYLDERPYVDSSDEGNENRRNR